MPRENMSEGVKQFMFDFHKQNGRFPKINEVADELGCSKSPAQKYLKANKKAVTRMLSQETPAPQVRETIAKPSMNGMTPLLLDIREALKGKGHDDLVIRVDDVLLKGSHAKGSVVH